MNKGKLKQIIDYIITEPDTESDALRTYKYPFVSSEILGITSSSLLDLYFAVDQEDENEEEESGKTSGAKKALAIKQQNNENIASTLLTINERLAKSLLRLKPGKLTEATKPSQETKENTENTVVLKPSEPEKPVEPKAASPEKKDAAQDPEKKTESVPKEDLKIPETKVEDTVAPNTNEEKVVVSPNPAEEKNVVANNVQDSLQMPSAETIPTSVANTASVTVNASSETELAGPQLAVPSIPSMATPAESTPTINSSTPATQEASSIVAEGESTPEGGKKEEPVKETIQEDQEKKINQEELKKVTVQEAKESRPEEAKKDCVQEEPKKETAQEEVKKETLIQVEPNKEIISAEPNKETLQAEPTKESVQPASVQAEPTKENVQAKPTEENVQIEPDKENVQAESAKENVQAEPAKENAQIEPTKESIQVEPAKENSQAEPTKESAQVEPAKENSQAESTKESAQVEPTKENSQTEPTKENAQVESTKEIIQTEPAHLKESAQAEPNPADSTEKFAREKEILDKCLADLESEYNIDVSASGENTALGSEESEAAKKYELVHHLFSFIDVPITTELNEVLAGYFKRAAIALITGKPKEMAEFFETNEAVLHNLFVHAHNKSVSEVLCKVLSIEETYITNPMRFNQTRGNILYGALMRIEGEMGEKIMIPDSYTLDQLSQVFCDLIEQCKEVPSLCCSDDLLKKIFVITLDKNAGISAAGLKILIKLLELDKSPVKSYLYKLLSDIYLEEEPEEEKLANSEVLLKLIVAQLIFFKQVLLEGSV